MYATNAMVDDGEVLQGTLNVIGRLSITAARRLEAELQVRAYSFIIFSMIRKIEDMLMLMC
jgi:hypothetical protein